MNKKDIEGKIYWNTPKFCLVCFKKFTEDDPRIRHHIKYFPEEIGFVHYSCHKKIHDYTNKIESPLIQYEEGDSRKFYEMKKERKENA